MKIKIIIKTLLILLPLLSSDCTLFSEEYYRMIIGRDLFGAADGTWNGIKRNPYLFKQFNEELTHFPRRFYSYVILQNDESIKEYNNAPNEKQPFHYYGYGQYIFQQPLSNSSFNKAYFITDLGVLVIDAPGIDPKFKWLDREKDFNAISPQPPGVVFQYFQGVVPLFDSAKDLTYYYVAKDLYMFKVADTNLTEREFEFLYPDNEISGERHGIYPNDKYNHLLFENDSTIWIALSNYPGILQFNAYTKAYKLWDNDNLPIKEFGMKYTSINSSNIYTIRSLFLEPKTKIPIFAVSSSYVDSNYDIHTESALLFYKNGLWDTIKIDPIESPYYLANTWAIANAFSLEGCNKIAIVFNTEANVLTLNERLNLMAVMFYDFETRTYEYVKPPVEMFDASEGNSIYYIAHTPMWVDTYKSPDGQRGVGILHQAGFFYQYVNTDWKWNQTSIGGTEAKTTPDLWFMNVYPNPVVHNTVTSDIMCLVKDINKVELGLYNLMGQRLLDLTNQFEYSATTATIYVTFTMPSDLPKGVYYLNVRNGDESRTKAIVISE